MSNNVENNTMVVYGRRADGTLSLLNPALSTGGDGAVIGAVPGTAPLFSSFSVIPSLDERFIFAVNGGSNTISVFKVLPDFDLRLVEVQNVPGSGPVALAQRGSLLYVAIADADGEFGAPASKQGLLFAFRIRKSGKLVRIGRSKRKLFFRPTAIRFSPDGRFLIVTDGFTIATSEQEGEFAEMYVYPVKRDGTLGFSPISRATSTEPGNEEGRALPTVFGFDIVRMGSTQYVVASEVRGLARNGSIVEELQTGSVSVWTLQGNGALEAVQLDVLTGTSFTEGETAACWLEFSLDLGSFWIANTQTASISSFSFEDGMIRLEEARAAEGPGPVDLWVSSDGKFLYQYFAGSVGAFKIEDDGTGPGLTEIQRPMDVPPMNGMGIVAI